jgi:hypothetical protein
VVVSWPGGTVSTSTFAAGWPGSDLRLWQVSVPAGSWPLDGPEPAYTATAYTAAGQVAGRVRLGSPDF